MRLVSVEPDQQENVLRACCGPVATAVHAIDIMGYCLYDSELPVGKINGDAKR